MRCDEQVEEDRKTKMTTGTAAIQANTGASLSFLSNGGAISSRRVSQQPLTVLTGQSGAGQSATPEDSVQLSDTTQQIWQSAQSQDSQSKGLVAQLVQAAAAGDTGALSLLTVI
jgi:hypothetical protein